MGAHFAEPGHGRRGFNAEGIEPLKDSLEIAHRTIIGKPSEPAGTPECSSGNKYFTVDDMMKTAKIYALTAMKLYNKVG